MCQWVKLAALCSHRGHLILSVQEDAEKCTRPVSGTVSFQGHRKQPEEVGEILMWPDSARQGLDLLLCIGFTDCN